MPLLSGHFINAALGADEEPQRYWIESRVTGNMYGTGPGDGLVRVRLAKDSRDPACDPGGLIIFDENEVLWTPCTATPLASSLLPAVTRGWTCPQCPGLRKNSIHARATVLRHLLAHTGETPYACKICFQAYRDPRSYGKHMAKHAAAE